MEGIGNPRYNVGERERAENRVENIFGVSGLFLPRGE